MTESSDARERIAAGCIVTKLQAAAAVYDHSVYPALRLPAPQAARVRALYHRLRVSLGLAPHVTKAAG